MRTGLRMGAKPNSGRNPRGNASGGRPVERADARRDFRRENTRSKSLGRMDGVERGLANFLEFYHILARRLASIYDYPKVMY